MKYYTAEEFSNIVLAYHPSYSSTTVGIPKSNGTDEEYCFAYPSRDGVIFKYSIPIVEMIDKAPYVLRNGMAIKDLFGLFFESKESSLEVSNSCHKCTPPESSYLSFLRET